MQAWSVGLRENPQLLIDDASADAIRPLGI